MSTSEPQLRLAVYWSMSDQDFKAHPGTRLPSAKARPLRPVAPHRDLSTILGELANDNGNPHEGERDIVASAIHCALQSSGTEELPNLTRLLHHSAHEIESRAAKSSRKDLSLRGSLDLVPVLALCAQIHRNGFVNSDGWQARSLLFLALVDLAIHCPQLIRTTSFTQAVNGLRILLERLTAAPQASSATLHFSVWQLFDWVAEHPQIADYVKRAVASLRTRFLVAWRDIDAPENHGTEEDHEEDALVQEEVSPDEAFWAIPTSSRFEVELPAELERNLHATQLTRVTALSRFASASLLVRSDEAMSATVTELLLQANKNPSEDPHALAKLLSIACCLPMDRVQEIRWSCPGTFPGTPPYPGVLTLDARWLIRSEFNPRSSQQSFHPRTVHVPIPEPLAKLLREHGSVPNAGNTVLAVREGDFLRVPREASAWETTLASRLMRDKRFGISVAQHVMHTSFGLDTAPLYYDSIPAGYLAHAIARITHPWFACAPRPHAIGVPAHNIGSQRIAAREEVRAFLQRQREGWTPSLELWEKIRLRSINLRYGFMLSVASRTNHSIGEITLYSIARGDGLATVADKAIAIDHPHRMVALGTKLVDELDRYLAELHQATLEYSGTALAAAAEKILAAEGCLFLVVHSVNECHAITLGEHLAADPPWAKGIPNWPRQYANAKLAEKLPEPLRAAQMGWTGTRAGAMSELSLQAPVDAFWRVRTVVEALLKESGWAPLPASEFKTVLQSPVRIHWLRAKLEHARTFQQGLERLKHLSESQRLEFAEKALPAVNAFFRANDIALVATTGGIEKIATGQAISLDRRHHEALLRAMGADRHSRMLASEVLYRWMSKARREKVIAGPLPRSIVRSWPRHPGAFLQCAHHSIGHRDVICEAARCAELSFSARTFLAVLLEGWIADADFIVEIMQPGAALHDLKEADVLLVEPGRSSSIPTIPGAVAFTGVAAVALRAWHRGGDAHALDRVSLQNEVHAAIQHVLADDVQKEDAFGELETLMRTYWALRAPGIVRDVVIRRVTPSFAPLHRIEALHENHPIWPKEAEPAPPTRITISESKIRRLKAVADYDKTKELLSSFAASWTPGKDAEARAHTITALRLLVPGGGPRNGGHIVALYAAAYLTEGLRKDKVRPVTVQDAVYSVGAALVDALPQRADLSQRDLWGATYARALLACEPVGRTRLARDLMHFQQVMAREHDLPMVNLAPLMDALEIPAPPETLGFLTAAEQHAVISISRYRVEAVAGHDTPSQQQDTLCALAISASALSSSLRDREFRVPLQTDWQENRNGTAGINLRSHGQDFVKTQAGRRAVDFTGPFNEIATKTLGRLSDLISANSVGPSKQKLFSPSSFSIEDAGLSDVIAGVNADLRYVTDSPLATIAISRKTWALSAFRTLGYDQSSLWPARDLLSRIGQVAIGTMQGHYLHDPLVFLERMPKGRDLSAAEAGMLLGMNPKAAHRLLRMAHSWLRPKSATEPVSSRGVDACALGAAERHHPFEPTLRETQALLELLGHGRSVCLALECLAWPRRYEGVIEQILADLNRAGVVIGRRKDESDQSFLSPPRMHSHPSLDACMCDGSCWGEMAWIFDQWLLDWRARDKKGVTVRSDEWDRSIRPGSPVSRLPWRVEVVGHMTFRRMEAAQRNAHSPWPAFRWIAASAWFRQRILDFPLPCTPRHSLNNFGGPATTDQ